MTLLPIYDCLLDYSGDRLSCNATLFAIISLQPIRDLLLPLAGITSSAAETDIFSSDYGGIIDDVLPARRLFGRFFMR